jgi:hypothetical protein
MSINEEALLTWNPSLEQYLVDTAEKCMGYAWIHKQAETMYSRRTIFLDIPTIVIGAVNGFISVGSKQIFKDNEFAPVYIGMISLFVSLLNTISSYFSWGRRAEAHKLASNSYSRLCRMISVEMNTKPRSERMPPHKLLEYVQGNYNSLCENSPLVPPPIVDQFNHKFGTLKDFSLPEETNGLHAVTVYNGSDPADQKSHPLISPIMDKIGDNVLSSKAAMENAISGIVKSAAEKREAETIKPVTLEMVNLADVPPPTPGK